MRTLGYILLTLAIFFIAMFTIVACAFNFALIYSVWDQPPTGWHIRPFGWDGLLVLNVLCTFLVSDVAWFAVIWIPMRIDHVNANRSGNADAH